ncbi:MAG: hypothetical protein FJX20_14085 [Alphaproteobacteria bacterium]|nr:hypothetical protein [Alphaproteobacteria bacterium]
MARDRTLPTDFWTWEAVIDCSMMARLLFLGLWNFADDHGVQPLRPRTIRMQVFPGDAIDEETVRALIEELVARRLVRIFAVEGQEYLSVIHWEQVQRVGRRARHRYPPDPPKAVPLEPASPPDTAKSATDSVRVSSRWREAIRRRLEKSWPGGPPSDIERWMARWLMEGHTLERDVLPAIDAVCQAAADGNLLADLSAVSAHLATRSLARKGTDDATPNGSGLERC